MPNPNQNSGDSLALLVGALSAIRGPHLTFQPGMN